MLTLFPQHRIFGGISDADEDTLRDEILIRIPKGVSVAVNVFSM
jgi:hypothetical protein